MVFHPQLRGAHILEAARLHRLGFPEAVPLAEFVRRFGLVNEMPTKDLTAEQILSSTDIDVSSYRIGVSQVLLRSGILSQLEAKRDELLSDRITQLQANCRGYLMRKKLAQRRVQVCDFGSHLRKIMPLKLYNSSIYIFPIFIRQELAVRCIQRNVRAFLAVRDWPWWRLLVRVTPLLNVHRTEEQLKIANDELVALRAKFEKIEADRNTLKTDNCRLESKVRLNIYSKKIHQSPEIRKSKKHLSSDKFVHITHVIAIYPSSFMTCLSIIQRRHFYSSHFFSINVLFNFRPSYI